jgi:hypothetical protein
MALATSSVSYSLCLRVIDVSAPKHFKKIVILGRKLISCVGVPVFKKVLFWVVGS